MSIDNKKFPIDVDGSDVMSKVLLDLLNAFPGLTNKKIEFSSLSEDSGIGFFPSSGAVITSQKRDITDHVKQNCSYPFDIVYREAPVTEKQRLRIKEFLDTLGKWLEKQPVTINGKEHKLESYPELSSDSRTITSINRTTPAYLNSVLDDGVENWVLSVNLRYDNEFDL